MGLVTLRNVMRESVEWRACDVHPAARAPAEEPANAGAAGAPSWGGSASRVRRLSPVPGGWEARPGERLREGPPAACSVLSAPALSGGGRGAAELPS
jgi:hypothetical protein